MRRDSKPARRRPRARPSVGCPGRPNGSRDPTVDAACSIAPERPGLAVAGDTSGGWSRIRPPYLSLSDAAQVCRESAPPGSRCACSEALPAGTLTFAQAEALLKGAEGTSMYAYIVVALLTGARTEELRALTWDHVFLKGRPDLDPPQPPHIAVWRSVRRSGDTKTRKSRLTLALPTRCVDALWQQFEDRGWDRLAADEEWEEHGLVFSSAVGSRSMPPTSAVPSGRSSGASTGSMAMSGRRGSCGTASSRCCPTGACRWRTSLGSSSTRGRP